MSVLKVSGNKIVDGDGHEVILKGAGLGGWMNMENFITGYPGHENGMRRAVKKVLGQEKYDYFFDKLLEYFFTDADAKAFKELGLNCLRLPFNYRHFEDDLNPGVFIEQGFKQLDRVVQICADHGIYTILDLHAAPGGQNIDWHSDMGIHRALFWEHEEFMARTVSLWKELARRYKGNYWVAGYNPLNEPTDEEHVRVTAFYERVEKAIREVDPGHILFFDGNTFAADFSHFGDPLPNCVYACHDYSNFGFPGFERYKGTDDQQGRISRSFGRKVEYMKKHNGPIWNGEFGPVYASSEDGPEFAEVNSDRYHLLKDQLSIYKEVRASWSIWLWKDIGYQGMTYVSPESPYIKLLKPFLEKKKRLAADAWGADTVHVKSIFQPIETMLNEEVPGIKHRYPRTWGTDKHVGRILRNILLSEELYPEYAAYFKDLSIEQLDDLAKSFKYENCVQRDELNQILRDDAQSQ